MAGRVSRELIPDRRPVASPQDLKDDAVEFGAYGVAAGIDARLRTSARPVPAGAFRPSIPVTLVTELLRPPNLVPDLYPVGF